MLSVVCVYVLLVVSVGNLFVSVLIVRFVSSGYSWCSSVLNDGLSYNCYMLVMNDGMSSRFVVVDGGIVSVSSFIVIVGSLSLIMFFIVLVSRKISMMIVSV